jgi:amino acid transporter
VVPPLSLFSVSVFSKMTFGALVGLEYASIFSGESRNPLRDFPRAILIAVPIVILLYIRLPMVAGWDQLLPAWFTRLHPKYRTPVNSILFLGAITLVTGIAALIGVRELEAFSMLQIWSFAFYGLAYLALFAIPIFAKRESRLRSAWPLKLAAASGLALTLLFVALSIFPIVDVADPRKYAVKTVAVLIGANCLALVLFYLQRRRKPAL